MKKGVPSHFAALSLCQLDPASWARPRILKTAELGGKIKPVLAAPQLREQSIEFKSKGTLS